MMSKRPVGVDDLFNLSIVDELDVDASGQTAIFSETVLDRDENRYRSRLWHYTFDDERLTALTSGSHRDTKPAWAPDGRSIAFLSSREGASQNGSGRQLFLLPASGGEAKRLTNLDSSIEVFAWSPDSRRIVFVSAVRSNDPLSKTDVKVITTPRFRADGDGYLDDRFKQLFELHVDTGAIRQITRGEFDHTQPAWSPTGNEIACISNRDAGWEYRNDRHIYLIKVESGHIRRLTDRDGRWSLPAWSPDGRSIASYGTRNLTSGSARNEIFVTQVASGETTSSTAEVDVDFRDSSIGDWAGYSLDPPVWTDENRVVVVASVRGAVYAVEVELDTGAIHKLSPAEGRLGHPRKIADGAIAAVRSTFTDPGELVRIDEAGNVEQLTNFNSEWRVSVELIEPAPILADSEDGEEIAGWLVTPANASPDSPAPLLLEIHGGPFGMYAETFVHEFQVLAGQGYAVLFANPRGSAGYGDRFAGLLLPEMGNNDFPDLIAILDEAVKRPEIDGDRLGVLGGSYGGFMTSWVISHSDRFNAAVTQRTVTDWFSAWGTDDIFYADENVTLGATPWEDPDLYFKISPISYVDQITTPTLIIHSEEDYRCPIAQGEELFTALMRLGVPTEFVRFPDESHGLSRTGQPKHRLERLHHILRWFETYL